MTGRLCLLAALLLVAAVATAQQLSDLEPARPISIEDARPVSYREFSGSADWTYNVRNGGLNDHGPGFSLLFGALRGLELGGSVAYLTRPGRNAARGISSGDIVLHALYGLRTESEQWPALAIRAGVEFPTGLDSKGTDLHLAGLATRSFESFRMHANFLYTRLGATEPFEHTDRFEGILGFDKVISPPGLTTTLFVGDASLRSNPVRGENVILTVEAGIRQRIGSQTLFFFGAGSELTGHDRTRLKLRAGFSHAY
jgi:hypothetical protein